MSNRKGIAATGFKVARMAENNRESMITASVLLYVAFYLVVGVGGISFNAQPVLGYLSTAGNSNCPAGSVWVEGNALHWCDGSTEYYTVDETGDPITLVDGASSGPSGSIWIEGSDFHWIDAQDDEYSYTGTDTGNNPGAASGSTWIEGGYIHYIDESGNERAIDW